MKNLGTSVVASVFAGLLALHAHGDDKAMIDSNTDRALTWLRASDPSLAQLMDEAAGVLVFPDIVKMGFGVGGEFGEGALLVDGQPEAYYATAGEEFGLGPESEFKAEMIFFMTDDALRDFRSNHAWQVDDRRPVAVIKGPGDAAALTGRSDAPVLGVVLSEDGLITHLELHGDRITRIAR